MLQLTGYLRLSWTIYQSIATLERLGWRGRDPL